MTGMLFGFVGYLGSGKSTIAKGVAAISNNRVVNMGFSDPMYDVFSVLGVPSEILADKARWNEPLAVLGGRTLRYGFRTLGTDWGRNMMARDIWTRIALERAATFQARGSAVIVDNCRFGSEFDALKAAGARMFAISRSALEPELDQESEREIAALQKRCECTIFNDCEIENAILVASKTIFCVLDGKPY